MEHRGLDPTERHAVPDSHRFVGELNRAENPAELLDDPDSLGRHGSGDLVDAAVVPGLVDANAKAANTISDGGQIVQAFRHWPQAVGSSSAPAMAPSMAAASAVERVIVPMWSRVAASS